MRINHQRLKPVKEYMIYILITSHIYQTIMNADET